MYDHILSIIQWCFCLYNLFRRNCSLLEMLHTDYYAVKSQCPALFEEPWPEISRVLIWWVNTFQMSTISSNYGISGPTFFPLPSQSNACHDGIFNQDFPMQERKLWLIIDGWLTNYVCHSSTVDLFVHVRFTVGPFLGHEIARLITTINQKFDC